VADACARPDGPIGFAHRGARAERRENTIDAFSRALELGANGLESDAWVTSDGVAVLEHDGVTGPWWRRRAISVQKRTDLPAHIPSLEELYEKCGVGFELSLDVKDPGAVGAIMNVSIAAGAAEHLWLCYHDGREMARWRDLTGSASLVESTSLSRIPEGLGARAQTLNQAGIAALNLRRSAWDPDRVATVHEAGLLAFGWDAQTSRQISRLLELGVDGIYSDHVSRMVAVLTARRGAGA
jgi:glycerophosphoryl diester phosphodiesterase